MQEINEKPYKQFALRMDRSLSEKLDRVSNATGIPKTTILRNGAIRILEEMDSCGAVDLLLKVTSN